MTSYSYNVWNQREFIDRVLTVVLITHLDMKSPFCSPCTRFLDSAISAAISGSTSRFAWSRGQHGLVCGDIGHGNGRALTISFGTANIMMPLKSIMRTMGDLSMPSMLRPLASV